MLFVVFLVVLVIQSPVFAQEDQKTVLYPTDDAYVDMIAPTANFGSAPQLELSWNVITPPGGGPYIIQGGRLAYLKFNLSLSEGSVIRSAFLKLYVTDAVTNSSIITVLPEKNTTWTEKSITGKNAQDVPNSESEVKSKAIAEVNITEVKTWYSLNVTSYVRSVRSGLLSFMVLGGNTQPPLSELVKFYSKESSDPALRPNLEVTYSGAEAGLVYLSLRSSLAGGSVYFNGTEYKIPNSLEVILTVPVGRYRIGASSTIPINDRAKDVFQKWSDGSLDNPRDVNVSKSTTLEAEYIGQYYLNVTTQYGAANGAGWYGNGTTATVGVSGDPGANPPRVKVQGIPGVLGVSYVFDHWSGYPTRNPSLGIVVDGPLTVTAIWREDYALLYSNLLRGLLSLGAGFLAAWVVRKRVLATPRRIGMSDQQRAEPKPAGPGIAVAPEAPAEPPPPTRAADALAEVTQQSQLVRDDKGEPARIAASTTVTSAAPMEEATKFCRECGAKIPGDSKYCEECGKKLA